MKILFFIEGLNVGGRERRFVELIHYLNDCSDVEIKLVLMDHHIHFKDILDLNLSISILKRNFTTKDPNLFFSFHKIVKKFGPDIIHAWNGMTTFYAVPSSKIMGVPIINNQICDTFRKMYRSNFRNFIWAINRYFSARIVANSKTGLVSYNVKKGDTIYNGIRLERFRNLKNKSLVREEFGLNTKLIVLMVANFTKYKDYALFNKVANEICNQRNDVTFVGVGSGAKKFQSEQLIDFAKNENIRFYERIYNVEELVNVCNIGVLFSNMETGEGISNSILEYMALSKPVIATKSGATFELVTENESGYLVEDDEHFIVEKIQFLLDNPQLREKMGEYGRKIIENSFTVDIMGQQYFKLYENILTQNSEEKETVSIKNIFHKPKVIFKNVIASMLFWPNLLLIRYYCLKNKTLIILNYHNFSKYNNFIWRRGNILETDSDKNFDSQMSFINKYFNFCYPNEYFENPDYFDRAIMITFDDGYKDNYDLAYPVLQKYRASCIFFVVSKFIETDNWLWHDKVRFLIKNELIKPKKGMEILHKMNEGKKVSKYFIKKVDQLLNENKKYRLMMNWSELSEMRDKGFKIGGHTSKHKILTFLNHNDQEIQIEDCIKDISDNLNIYLNCFAYPNGLYDLSTIKILKKKNVRFAFTTQQGLNYLETDPLQLRRIGVNTSDTKSVMVLKILVAIFAKKMS